MTAKENRPESAQPGAASWTLAYTDSLWHHATDDAFIVVVLTPLEKTVRRPYMSLHGATQALVRARAKGQTARIVLCRLTAVTVFGEGS